MFTAETPSYAIDLDLPEPERWREVIAAEQANARRLIDRAAADLERVPRTARWTFGQLYRMFGGLYQGEIAAWAGALGVSVGTATMLNCLYELSHLPQPKWLGCTAGIRWLEGHGMVHVRTLDWPIDGMGEATRLFRFRRGAREFVSVAMPGQVGMLSGMLPGAYSVTINWAPPAALPNFDFGPGFLLRDVFETCDTYAAAVERLERERLSTSVFYTVCGAERGQACVIERTQAGAAVRRFADGPLVQANHHIAQAFSANNEAIREVPPEEEVFSIDGSSKRVKIMQDGLAALPATCSLEAATAPLDVPTVFNSQTCQKMVFCPATGELKLWRLVSEA
ncbi:MAG TPA: C45 family peptidase [Pirellulaceae bacterium]|nr:C45 family peptidase [Pirellulaceae bacterium]